MRTWPRLDIIVPCHPTSLGDWAHLRRFLQSLKNQDYPHEALRLYLITKGNSEEAKAYGIQAGQGQLIGMFCADNVLLKPDDLRLLAQASKDCDGSYTCRYAYVPTDTALSRYFALLGANDPLCWWVGKADRLSYLSRAVRTELLQFNATHHLPSLGDNGFLFHRRLLQGLDLTPARFGSCMDLCHDLVRLHGELRLRRVGTISIWHRTGESLPTYFQKRWRYVNALYFDRLATRRWNMVCTPRDWVGVVTFTVASVLVLPHLLVSVLGALRRWDPAWFLHPVICGVLTLSYACGLMRHLLKSVWSFVVSTGKRN